MQSNTHVHHYPLSITPLAGKGVANPLATILSAAMMLRHSFNLEVEAKAMENAVCSVLDEVCPSYTAARG